MNVNILLDNRSLLCPVRDQGARPTCLSFACTTAHECALGTLTPLSPEYLHYFAAVGSQSQGVRMTEIMHALLAPGQPKEVDCPYQLSGVPSGWRPPDNVSLYTRQSSLRESTPQAVEAALNRGCAPVLGISIPDSFYFPASPWIVSPAGQIRGSHAVVAVGYGTELGGRYFLIRNSWGKEWGDGGHAWLGDDFLTTHLRELLEVIVERS